MTVPTFSVYKSKVVYENPKCITDGFLMYREATIEIETKDMSQTFLHLLMHHMGEGNIRVKVARLKEQA